MLAAGITHWGLRLSSTESHPVDQRQDRRSLRACVRSSSRSCSRSRRSASAESIRPRGPTSLPGSRRSHGSMSPVHSAGRRPRRGPAASPRTDSRIEVGLGVAGPLDDRRNGQERRKHVAPPIEIDTSLRPVASPAANGMIAVDSRAARARPRISTSMRSTGASPTPTGRRPRRAPGSGSNRVSFTGFRATTSTCWPPARSTTSRRSTPKRHESTRAEHTRRRNFLDAARNPDIDRASSSGSTGILRARYTRPIRATSCRAS